MREKMEKFLRDQIEDVIDELERIKRHTESGDYTLDEIGEELEDLIKGL